MRSAARAWSERVTPRVSMAAPRPLRLREPRGVDELALDGIDTRAGVALLDRLVEPSLETGELAASDRDALFAALHRGLWGDRIVSSLDCGACGAPYDLSFEISALQRGLEQGREPVSVVEQRSIADAGGGLYRLPGAVDEDIAARVDPVAGRVQLAAAIAGDADADALDMRLEALAPIIDVDLDLACAECGHAALARFDLQSFTLQRLLDEREATLSEVDSLASGYGWSLGDILGLARGLRRALAERLAARRA